MRALQPLKYDVNPSIKGSIVSRTSIQTSINRKVDTITSMLSNAALSINHPYGTRVSSSTRGDLGGIANSMARVYMQERDMKSVNRPFMSYIKNTHKGFTGNVINESGVLWLTSIPFNPYIERVVGRYVSMINTKLKRYFSSIDLKEYPHAKHMIVEMVTSVSPSSDPDRYVSIGFAHNFYGSANSSQMVSMAGLGVVCVSLCADNMSNVIDSLSRLLPYIKEMYVL